VTLDSLGTDAAPLRRSGWPATGARDWMVWASPYELVAEFVLLGLVGQRCQHIMLRVRP
jgi:hypothetical protein